jgi:putative membrane protein
MTCPQHEHHLDLPTVASWWTIDPLVIGTLLLSTIVYVRGVVVLRRRGHGVRTREVLAYATAIVSIAIALLSPLDRLSDVLFSAHMGQHEILILVAPPLLVLGRPFAIAPFGLPDALRSVVVSTAQREAVRRIWRALTHPVLAVAVHGIVLWLAHVPALFEAALADERIHAVQHLAFFGTAVLFWWALVHGRYGRLGYGVSVLWVFVTAAHSGALGALLTVAPRLWYRSYDVVGRSWGVSPIEDQRLAGLLMWIPTGVVFVVLGLALFAAWLGEAERRALRLPYGAPRRSEAP